MLTSKSRTATSDPSRIFRSALAKAWRSQCCKIWCHTILWHSTSSYHHYHRYTNTWYLQYQLCMKWCIYKYISYINHILIQYLTIQPSSFPKAFLPGSSDSVSENCKIPCWSATRSFLVASMISIKGGRASKLGSQSLMRSSDRWYMTKTLDSWSQKFGCIILRRLRTSFSVCLWFLEYWLYHPVTGYSIVCHRIVMFNSPRGIPCLQPLRLLLGGTRSWTSPTRFGFPPLHWRAAHSVAPRPHGGIRHLAWTPIELLLVGDSWHQEAACCWVWNGVNVFWDAVFGRFECSTYHVDLNKKYEKHVDFRSSGDCMQCKSVLSRFSVLTRSSKSTLW